MMEDENGIELSLGLSCGGSVGKLKSKDGSSSDIKTVEGGVNNKPVGDLKNFYHTGTQKQDLDADSQKSDLVKSQENFFTNLANTSETGTSKDSQGKNNTQFPRYGGLWAPNVNRSTDVDGEKSDQREIGGKLWTESGNKRKMLFEETNHQKKQERDVPYGDVHGKHSSMAVISSVKASHVSMTTEDRSTAENEDVAESEAEGSTSRQGLHDENGTKRYMGSAGSSEFPKEKHGISDSSAKDMQGQKQSNVPPGNESNIGNLTYGIPYSLQPLSVMTVPSSLPVKVPNSNGPSSTSGFPGPCVMQMMPCATSEWPVSQPLNPSNMPLTFGYSTLQLPTLETDQPWGMVSHVQQFPPSYAGRNIGSVIANSDKSEDGLKISQAVVQGPSHSSSEASPYDSKASESAKGSGKQRASEEGGAISSSQTEDFVKGNGMIFRPKEASDQSAVDGFPYEGSAIRPGIDAGVKFGGRGSCPDLPWVSTTGPGPNGRTISGVTYRVSKNQVKIVCACHGSHMSPEEFIQHASADQHNPENSSGFVSFPNGNPASSAQG
ncbi:ninja-family protein mc410 [Macadamia integrifolia]|uniref:ninja-family protein mc410 n=1 Tax=Macadamia integrifolia TaxID=60698 RepID=UPI001C4E3CD4|nr:ninja-family protein mc410 [Macadamia integrifolia]XP_042486038.1 ninja-family protein mc410 [Macadamia integrifolia]